MAKYSIQDTSLIAIGDAIRNKTGEHTRVEYIPKEAWIFKTNNVNSLEEAMEHNVSADKNGFRDDVEETIVIPGAVKLVLQVVITADYYDMRYELPEYADGIWYSVGVNNRQLKTFEIIGDTITIKIVNAIFTAGKNAFYAEARGYDEDGNLIKDENSLVEIIVPNTLTPAQMATEIEELPMYEPPAEAFTITGYCGYRFVRDGWTWFIKDFGDKITTKDITDANNMFNLCSKLTDIPFDINIRNDCTSLNNIFSNCTEITRVPLIKGDLNPPTGDYTGPVNLSNLFYSCSNLREIPDDYFYQFGGEAYWEASKNYQGNRSDIFSYCYSLRKLPDISMLNVRVTSIYNSLYYINNLLTLDELINFPVMGTSTFTSNAFQNFAGNLFRAKNITFEVNEDGSPKTANWKNQTINFTNNVGYGVYAYHDNYITDHNSGITADKAVFDDASYQALKDDPDWYVKATATNQYRYSRYNHDSAVNTINSLPDTSAYLAANGGTNTIKFFGPSGEATDGGAINTLTEEEIAVAAAKGWTVTLA